MFLYFAILRTSPRADLGGVLGVLKHPPSRFIAPLSKVLLVERGTGKSCSSVSLDNLHVMATVEEGRMEGLVVEVIVHNASSSRLRPFFFFLLFAWKNWRR